MSQGLIRLQDGALSCALEPVGAELKSLIFGGVEQLWAGDTPGLWAATAPILFPVIGKSLNGGVDIGGRPYGMPQHGFARASPFSVVRTSPATCSLRLGASPGSLAVYPFDFELVVTYSLTPRALEVTFEVANLGASTMPFSLGWHPGFSRAAPRPGSPPTLLVFPRGDETFWGLQGEGFRIPNPLRLATTGGALLETDELFANAAAYASERPIPHVELVTPGRARVAIRSNFPTLALWSQSGANFLCIESWQGTSALVNASKDALEDRPGTVFLPLGGVAVRQAMIEFIVDQ